MPQKSNNERLEYLHKLLSELAASHDACVASDFRNSGRCNSLRECMDSIAETMLSVMLDYRYPFRKNRPAELVPMVFLLDARSTVAGFSSSTMAVLKYDGIGLRRVPFQSLLSKHSLEIWDTVCRQETATSGIDAYLPLHFHASDGRIVPSLCHVTSLLPYSNIIVNASATLYGNRDGSLGIGPAEARIPEIPTPVRELHDYILSHLDEPLPVLRQLAGKFGMSEHALKAGFQKAFDSGIHGFYNEHRLLRALGQIRHTAMPLKEIAFACGFNSYLNFYKAFVKQFGHPPRDAR